MNYFTFSRENSSIYTTHPYVDTVANSILTQSKQYTDMAVAGGGSVYYDNLIGIPSFFASNPLRTSENSEDPKTVILRAPFPRKNDRISTSFSQKTK